MKNKITIIALITALVLLLSACGQTSAPDNTNAEKESTTAVENAPETEADSIAESETGAPEDSQTEEATLPNNDKNDVLVVVFSATGTTKGVAEKIADLTGADLYEIIPEEPYSSADLNYNGNNSRATKEQNDKSARPEIGSEDISLEGYKTVYIGYPIWWGQAPRIMSTFVEKYDFTGITVIPFCTSGSSDIGNSDDTLAEQAESGNWIQGKRFSGSTTEDELRVWIKETGDADMKKTLRLFIDGKEVSVEWENNETIAALTELVSSEPLTVQMSGYGGFEQVGPLGTSLPRNDAQMTTEAGDIVLYSGDQLVIFYGSNSWDYTRLGSINGRSAEDLEALLSGKNVTVKISFE